MKRGIALAVGAALLSLLAVFGSHAQDSAGTVRATQNLDLDPWGRVIDVAFDQDLSLTAPWDRFRFDIDTTQPLARDSGAFLGDLTGDGVPDLLLASFHGQVLFFPGLPGRPMHFGDGQCLPHTTSDRSDDPFYYGYYGHSAAWTGGDVGDLDGDGEQEIVVGQYLYANVGTSSEPQLDARYYFPGYVWIDAGPSIGDLNGDGKPDVLITAAYYQGTHIYWNHSTPGSFDFTRELLYNFGSPRSPENHLAFADLNGDGLLDLGGLEGIYLNTGTPQLPSFDFANPSPWATTGGPSWASLWDQASYLYFRDATGDGLLDAYVSSLQSTVWQVFFYENIGTRASPHLRYGGPVTVASSPLDVYYRGEDKPHWSGLRAYVASADIDQNGLTDLLLSTRAAGAFGAPTIVWSFPAQPGEPPRLTYQDLYTWPALDKVDSYCGEVYGLLADALCLPPNLFSAWIDLTGDGLPDVLRTDEFFDRFKLYKVARSGTWPFTLGTETPLKTLPSATQATGWGVAVIDVDLDGHLDLITGSSDGRLLHYASQGSPGAYSDPVLLADAVGAPIDVGGQSWPAPFDLDGDADLDLLVADESGLVHKVLCVAPGSAHGYQLGGLLGSIEQDPVEVTHTIGGGVIVPSLATADVDADGLDDVLMGTVQGLAWWLKNVGSAASPQFSLRPLTATQTTAAFLEWLDARHLRLRFAVPTAAGQTILAYHDLGTPGGPISGEVIIAGPVVLDHRLYVPMVARDNQGSAWPPSR